MNRIAAEERYRKPDPEIQRLLEYSRKESEALERRKLACPRCGFPLGYVYGHSGYYDAKCRKCKFTGPLNLAYFRLQRRNRHYILSLKAERAAGNI